jgi:hypothetical protein
MKTAFSSFADYIDASWSEERVKVEVAAHAARSGCSQDDLLNAVALELARRFDQQKIHHGEATAKAAALYNAVFGDSEVPRQLYAVYWALDEAEYGSEKDHRLDEDAPRKRARDEIRTILAAVARDDA